MMPSPLMPNSWQLNDELRHGIIAVLWSLLVFVTDLYTRLGFAHGILYLPAILLAVRLHSSLFSHGILALGIVGTLAGIWLAPEKPADMPVAYVYANRFLTLFALITTYILSRNYQRSKLARTQLKHQQSVQQRYFDNLVDSLPVQIWTAEPHGKVDYVGNKLLEFTGKTRESILAQWQSLLHPDDRARATETWQAAVENREPYLIDFRLRRSDGEYIWFKTGATLATDDSKQTEKWFGFAIDINDLIQVRDQAERLTESYQQTIESITDAFFTLDGDFRFSYLNFKAAELFGGIPDEMVGQSIRHCADWERLHADQTASFLGQLEKVYQQQAALYFETYYPPKQAWLDVRAYPSADGLTVYFIDTTTQREEQEQLNLLNTAVSRLNDIIMITDARPIDEPGPRTVFVNEAFVRKTGYSKEEVIGKSPRLLQGPDTDRVELDRIRQALKHWQPVRAQLLNYTKSGDQYWLELDIVPITNEAGNYTHWVSVERDITEQKRLQEQLIAAQRMESIGQLTGGMAHDFNNLLTVILTNAELLEEQLEDNPQLRRAVSLIIQAADKGSSLTQQLLAFARKQPLSPSVVYLDELLESLTPLLRSSVGNKNELHLHLAESLWPVIADPVQLENCILNLTLNARDAIREFGVINIYARNYQDESTETDQSRSIPASGQDVAPGKYVELCISDTGSGMSPELTEKIFEPFFTTKSEGRGSGLGLSMVYGFVKQSGGHISVHSELDIGTTFRLQLPTPTEVCLQPAAVSEPEARTVPGAAVSVLVVEDDAEICRTACASLKAEGMDVHAAADANQALALIEGGLKPDFLFTDIVMPGEMSGLELSAAVKEKLPGTRIVFASGYADTETMQQVQESGHPLLQKPYRRAQLVELVNRVLAMSSVKTTKS